MLDSADDIYVPANLERNRDISVVLMNCVLEYRLHSWTLNLPWATESWVLFVESTYNSHILLSVAVSLHNKTLKYYRFIDCSILTRSIKSKQYPNPDPNSLQSAWYGEDPYRLHILVQSSKLQCLLKLSIIPSLSTCIAFLGYEKLSFKLLKIIFFNVLCRSQWHLWPCLSIY